MASGCSRDRRSARQTNDSNEKRYLASRDIMYSVYTANGRYRAVALLPGNYEITVKKIGFAVDSRKVAIRAGANAVADFSMAIGEATPAQQPTFSVGAREDSIRYF